MPGLQHVDEHAKILNSTTRRPLPPVGEDRPSGTSGEGGEGWVVTAAKKNSVCSTAAKLARPHPTRGPGKRVSTSLCTFAAQIFSKALHFHWNSGEQKWKKDSGGGWPFDGSSASSGAKLVFSW